MKLILGLINNEDARGLLDALVQHKYRATVTNAPGIFLQQHDTAIFIGAEADQVARILSIIKTCCHTRTRYDNPLPPVMEPGEMFIPGPVNVQTGGATVFVLDVDQSHKF